MEREQGGRPAAISPLSDEWHAYYEAADQRFRANPELNPDAEIARRIETDQTVMPTLFMVIAVLGAGLYFLLR
jgi:hypothetical protein